MMTSGILTEFCKILLQLEGRMLRERTVSRFQQSILNGSMGSVSFDMNNCKSFL